MNTFKNFFQTIWQSIIDPKWYYRDAAKKPFSSALGYLYWFLVVASLLWIIPASIAMFIATPAVRTFVVELQSEVPNLYPPELVMTMDKGVLSTNVPEPFFIELPEKWRKFFEGDAEHPEERIDFDHSVTIDTKAAVEDFDSYKTLVLLTDTTAVVRDKSKGLRVIAYRDHEEFMKEKIIVTRGVYNKFTSTVLPYLNPLPSLYQALILAILLIGPFVVAGFALLGKLLWLLLGTLVLYVAEMFMKRRIPYWVLYRMGMYGVTGPTFLKILMFITGLGFPYLYSVYFCAWMAVVISKFLKTKTK